MCRIVNSILLISIKYISILGIDVNFKHQKLQLIPHVVRLNKYVQHLSNFSLLLG